MPRIPIHFDYSLPSITDIRNKFIRIGGMNSLDLSATAAAAYYLALYSEQSIVLSFIELFLLGEMIHYVIGQETVVTKAICSKC